MILNGYDTFVGKKISITDGVASTLKALSTANRLKPFGTNGVKLVDQETGGGIKTFIFPISLVDYRGNKITVMDTRVYTNASGKVVNPSEHEMMLTAAILQQLSFKGSNFILNSAKPYTIKAFANSVSNLLSRGGINLSQKLDLRVILAHYYNCLLTSESDDYKFVSQNAINQALRISPASSAPIIQEVGYINNFKLLVEAITTYPTLSSLSKLDFGGFIGVINRTWMVLSGFKEIAGASIEMPHLYTAICYASATHNIYKKTGIGQEVDPRENQGAESFVKTINGVWPE